MKRLTLIACVGLLCGLGMETFAIPIAQWTFEVNTPADLTDSSGITGIAADVGNGTASGFHASSATDWTTPAGNGSANSLNANNWAVGDYFQFRVSTLGYQGITVSWDQAGSSTGPRDFVLQYSIDGTSFTQVGSSYQASLSDWVAGTFHAGFTFSPSLTGIESAIANQPNVYFRLTDNSTTSIGGGTVAGGGTERVDNFTVSGNALPESSPGLLGWICILAMLLCSRRCLRSFAG